MDRHGVHAAQVGAGGVHHHGGVDALEGAGSDLQDLAAAPLLGRCADDGDPAVARLGHRGRGESGAQTGRSDDVVPAGVADAGQRVVLEADGDVRAGPAGSSDEGGLQAVGAALGRDALVLEHVAEQVVGVVLLEVQLGLGVDPVGHVDQEVGTPVDLLGHAVLDGVEVHRAERRGNSLEARCERCDTPPMPAIEVHQVTEDRPDLLAALAVVRAATEGEVNPDDPPAPVEELAAELFVQSPDVRRIGWVALLDGDPAGELGFAAEQHGDNASLVDVEWLAVDPAKRRQGVADALLRTGLDWAAADGRTSVVLWAPTLPEGTGRAYAARAGCTLRLEERCSRLAVAELDRTQQDEWLRAGRARADGYRIAEWVGPAPEEHLDQLAAAHRAMEDMPTDDLEWTVPTMTPERLRGRDQAWAAAGRHNVSTLVLAPDGAAAGLSELQINTHRPELASQGDTGVVGAHRGRGLGRWLKAENLRLALETEPRVRVVETYNAESNPWMLDINVAMGFRPHIGYQAFQGAITEVRAVLG